MEQQIVLKINLISGKQFTKLFTKAFKASEAAEQILKTGYCYYNESTKFYEWYSKYQVESVSWGPVE